MKIVPNKLLVAIIGFSSCNFTFAAPDPPAPVPPPPPGLPINGKIWMLVVIVVILAFYKLKYTKKASN